MKRRAVSKSNLPTLLKALCAGICLASLSILGGATHAQAPQKLVIKSDKKSPRKAPEKSTQRATRTADAGGGLTNTVPTEAAPAADTGASQQPGAAASSLSGCDFGTILLKDTIRVVYVELFNYPENSAIPVTVTQTNAGIIGYALTDQGPFNPTLNIIVNTNASGYGVSAPVFTQGQNVGQTVLYGDTPDGATTTIDFNVLPQCNCPPIPVIQ